MPLTNGFEKHAQTAIQVILVAITIWVGSAIITLRDSSIRMEEKHTQMRETLIELRKDMAQIQGALALGVERDGTITYNLRALETRMEATEKLVKRYHRDGN